MGREYGQPCSVASALDQIGERWSLLVVRELLLGPLRFSQLAREVGGAPTDVLTKRLRRLERAGIVARRDLGPPVSATVYELTALGRALEPALLELGRWGLHFQDPATVAEMPPKMLPNALRIVLRSQPGDSMVVGLRCEGEDYALRIGGGSIEARRGSAEEPDLILEGTPWEVMATVVAGEDDEEIGATLAGDRQALEKLRSMVAVPAALEQGARAEVAAATAAAT
jgi:DNA-binding HxlR family transcriptional regulator